MNDCSYAISVLYLLFYLTIGSSVAVIVPVVCVLVILITTVAVILLVFFLRYIGILLFINLI